jgi:hypothetical protein
MSLVAEQAAFLLDACKLVSKASEMGFTVTGGELYRSIEQQQIYMNTGKTKTMASNHLKRCAIDLNFFKDGKLVYDIAILKPVGDYWESLNPKNSWGGNWASFKDVPHFERRT